MVTGWYAMNLNNMHPQSFPWFYSVSVAVHSVAVTSTIFVMLAPAGGQLLLASFLQVTFLSVGLCIISYLAFLWWVAQKSLTRWLCSGHGIRCQLEVILICSTLLKSRYCWWKKLMFQ